MHSKGHWEGALVMPADACCAMMQPDRRYCRLALKFVWCISTTSEKPLLAQLLSVTVAACRKNGVSAGLWGYMVHMKIHAGDYC